MNEELSLWQEGQERKLTAMRCARDVADAGGVHGARCHWGGLLRDDLTEEVPNWL